MNKVWIVEVVKGDYETEYSEVFKITNTPGKAQLAKLHLEADIAKVKRGYSDQYGASFDDDWELITEEQSSQLDDDLYDELVDRLYTFQFQNNLLQITNIKINEHNVE